MELPVTKKGNCYVVVLKDLFTKWPLVFPTPDQKSPRLMRLIVNELIPVFGVPEAILSDRGANLLSHLMIDICELLGIQKLNTTVYHPQCKGMVVNSINAATITDVIKDTLIRVNCLQANYENNATMELVP